MANVGDTVIYTTVDGAPDAQAVITQLRDDGSVDLLVSVGDDKFVEAYVLTADQRQARINAASAAQAAYSAAMAAYVAAVQAQQAASLSDSAAPMAIPPDPPAPDANPFPVSDPRIWHT